MGKDTKCVYRGHQTLPIFNPGVALARLGSGMVPRVGYNNNLWLQLAPKCFSAFIEVVEVDRLLLYYNVAILQCKNLQLS